MSAMTTLHETMPKRLRALRHSEQLILGEVIRLPNQSRAQIAKTLALSPALLSKTIGAFVTEGLIAEKRVAQPSGRGQPALKLRVRSRAAAGLGLSLTTNGIVGATVGIDGATLQVLRDPTPASEPGGLSCAARLVSQLLATADQFASITIQVPGIIDPDGSIVEVTPTQRVIDFPAFRKHLETGFQLPVVFESRVAAVDEAMRTGQNDAVIFVLILNYGVGGSFISGKSLFRGASGQAGNIGALVPESGPRPSLPDLARHLGIGLESLDPEMLDPFEPRVAEWTADRGTGLSDALSTVVQLFNPSDIVIGGILPRKIIDRLIEHIDLHRFDFPGRSELPKPRLRSARTVGRDADAVAAAMASIHGVLNQQISDSRAR